MEISEISSTETSNLQEMVQMYKNVQEELENSMGAKYVMGYYEKLVIFQWIPFICQLIKHKVKINHTPSLHPCANVLRFHWEDQILGWMLYGSDPIQQLLLLHRAPIAP